MVNWSDPESMISKYFKVREAIFLPRWDRVATPEDGLTDEAKLSLIFLFQKMDVVREFIVLPVLVHCAFRPAKYNAEVGGASSSCHMARVENGVPLAAVDWHAIVDGETQGGGCDLLREKLLPKLEEWGLRLENNGFGAAWVHLDTKPVGSGSRYFKP